MHYVYIWFLCLLLLFFFLSLSSFSDLDFLYIAAINVTCEGLDSLNSQLISLWLSLGCVSRYGFQAFVQELASPVILLFLLAWEESHIRKYAI